MLVSPSFEAALDAVKDGETITLVAGATGDEHSKEIDFVKDIEFTVTGKAPDYAIPVITFQNATVNIVDAEFMTAELDARQNATINVVNSNINDAGGNSIIKSYYNGAINIAGTSEVYTMQVTTMGYITVSDTAKLNATWQTNVYGNGLVTVEDTAVLATGALNLTGKDYSGRDNTDTDRVGKPATVVVDGATLKVGEVYSSSGADYSYNADGYGINVGTISGKAALFDIKNGANVSLRMQNGGTVNFGADATVNVADSALKVICRGAGEVTLNNNGLIRVQGDSTLNIPVLSGTAVYVTDDTTLTDTVVGGAVYAGYGANKTDSLELAIAGNFQAKGLYVGNKYEHYTNGEVHTLTVKDGAVVNVGALYVRPTCVATVTNATVNAGDLFVRGSLTVNDSTMSHQSAVGGGTGHWAVYEDDDATKTAVLALNNSTVSTNYLVIGSNSNSETDANSNATLTVNGGSLTLKGCLYVQGSDTFKNNSVSFTDTTVTAQKAYLHGKAATNVYGECTVNIGTVTGGNTVDCRDGAILKDSTIGGGVYVLGNVTFAGDNTFAMLYDFGAAYSNPGAHWTVASGATVTLTDTARYGLGYGDKVTIQGALTNALTARVNLTNDDLSFFAHGIALMDNWDEKNYLTVKDAYVVLGSNNSFGTKSDYGAKGDFYLEFTNSVLDTSRITIDAAGGTTYFTFTDSDIKAGGWSSKQADSTATFTNSVMLVTGNGTDWNNENAGQMTLVNSDIVFQSGAFTNNGTLTLDATSSLTAPSITGAGKIVIDTTGMTAGEVTLLAGDLSGFTGTVEVVGDESLYAYVENGKVYLKSVVAKIGDVYYETLEAALKAVTDGCTLEILSDITIASDWDNRTTGAKITVPVTIDGNGHTLKFTGMISDGMNYLSVFRFEDVASVKDLTIDLSEATSGWVPRLRAISAKTDITIDNCTFIGKADYNNTNAVIIGEGAGAAMGDVVITITDSTFTNWRNGISDNQNGQDAKSATVTGNTFNNANVRIAAANSVVFNNNTMNNGSVTIASYTTPASLAVTAKGNALATGDAIVNEIKNADTIDAQNDFVGAAATVNGTVYGSLEAAFAAAQNGDTIVLIADVNAAVTYAVNKTLTLDLNGYEIESAADVVLTASAGELTIVDNSADKTGAIVSDGKTAIHSSAYVAIKSGKFDGAITTANGQIDDSQVCITGGTFTQNPDADLVEHSYTVLTNEDGTYTVVDTEYTLTIVNGGLNASGAGIYIYGDIVTVYAGEMNGYFFGEWVSEDVDVTGFTSDTVTFVMPDHDVTLTVYWSTTGPANPGTPVVLPGTLNFETNGGTPIDSISRVAGTKVDLSQFVTVREGYTFAGWYSDAALTKPVTVITLRSTKTVYAGWIENAVTPDIPVVIMPFTDVNAGDYYYNAVLWAAATGITNGTTATTFGPDAVCTRAQVVTFLWRAAGCPIAKTNDMPFTDVSRDMYYYDAVQWAVEQGITNGISDTEFGPDAECSRAQIVTFLWRSQGSPAVAADGGFHDVAADAYYATAVEWAVDNGITNGMGDNAFAPDAECTRAQTVTFLYRHFFK